MSKEIELKKIQIEIENYYKTLSNDEKILNEYFDIVELERHSQLYFKVFFSKMSFDTKILFIGINPGGGECWSSADEKKIFEYAEYNYPLARETKNVFSLANYSNLLDKLDSQNRVVKTNLYYLVTNNDKQLNNFIDKILNENQRIEFIENHKNWTSRIIELCNPEIIIYEGKTAYDNSPPYYNNAEKLVDYNQDGVFLVKLKDYNSTLIGYSRNRSVILNKESLAKILEKELDLIPSLIFYKDLLDKKLLRMNTSEYQHFKEDFRNHLIEKFWRKFQKRQKEVDVIYMFDFCVLDCCAKADESGQLFLCYSYEKKNNSEKNSKLQKIFSEIFENSFNAKYIGFHKFSNSEDFRDVLIAIFLHGNEIENDDLRKEILNEGNVNNILNKFKKSNLDSDEILNNYVEDIVSEFANVELKVRNALLSSGISSENFDFTEEPIEI